MCLNLISLCKPLPHIPLACRPLTILSSQLAVPSPTRAGQTSFAHFAIYEPHRVLSRSFINRPSSDGLGWVGFRHGLEFGYGLTALWGRAKGGSCCNTTGKCNWLTSSCSHSYVCMYMCVYTYIYIVVCMLCQKVVKIRFC